MEDVTLLDELLSHFRVLNGHFVVVGGQPPLVPHVLLLPLDQGQDLVRVGVVPVEQSKISVVPDDFVPVVEVRSVPCRSVLLRQHCLLVFSVVDRPLLVVFDQLAQAVLSLVLIDAAVLQKLVRHLLVVHSLRTILN